MNTQTETPLAGQYTNLEFNNLPGFARDTIIKLERDRADLLGALRDARRLVDDCERDVDYYICTEALIRRESIEAVIAKAEGQS